MPSRYKGSHRTGAVARRSAHEKARHRPRRVPAGNGRKAPLEALNGGGGPAAMGRLGAPMVLRWRNGTACRRFETPRKRYLPALSAAMVASSSAIRASRACKTRCTSAASKRWGMC